MAKYGILTLETKRSILLEGERQAMARRAKASGPVSVTEAIAYLRVSTAGQAASGLGLEAQAARIEAHCKGQGWTLVETFTDAGVSAKTLHRPALQKALAALRPGRVLVALKLDRLTRTARDLDDLTARVLAAGGEWATVEENYNTSTAMGRFMVRVVADIAQMEREVIGERTSAALQAKKARGERLGTTPLGYRTIETATGKRVVKDPYEQETVRMARELFNAGKSYRAIAAELTAAGRTTKRGGKWHAETVACLIRTRYLEEIAA
jgi:DNA invertase Pin-like site-specific DNA recombinase